jgi:hypothetical protein
VTQQWMNIGFMLLITDNKSGVVRIF